LKIRVEIETMAIANHTTTLVVVLSMLLCSAVKDTTARTCALPLFIGRQQWFSARLASRVAVACR
jgi:hypothetical protein